MQGKGSVVSGVRITTEDQDGLGSRMSREKGCFAAKDHLNPLYSSAHVVYVFQAAMRSNWWVVFLAI